MEEKALHQTHYLLINWGKQTCALRTPVDVKGGCLTHFRMFKFNKHIRARGSSGASTLGLIFRRRHNLRVKATD